MPCKRKTIVKNIKESTLKKPSQEENIQNNVLEHRVNMSRNTLLFELNETMWTLICDEEDDDIYGAKEHFNIKTYYQSHSMKRI